MTAGLLRLSVVAGSRRVDLAAPAALPVAELVPGLARSLGVVSYEGLHLCTITGDALHDEAGLASQGVADGAVLTLGSPPAPAVVHDDLAEALTAVPPGDPPPSWLTLAGAGLLLALGVVSTVAAAQPRAAAVLALLLLAGGLGVGRVAPGAAVVATAAASAYAATTAGLLAPDLRPGPGVVWAAAGGAALAVSALAIACLPHHRMALLPVLVVATAATLVGAVLSIRPVSLTLLAAALLVVTVLARAAVPWIAVGRISRPRGRVDPARVAQDARVARELGLGLAIGLAAVQTALVAVVARHGPSGAALAGCASTLAVLGSCHGSSSVDVLPSRLAGGLGWLATATVALWQHAAWRPVGAAVLAGAGGLLLAVPWLDAHGPVARPARRALEVGCTAALLPLLVLVTGALGRVA